MGHKQSKLKNYCSEMDKQMLQIYNDKKNMFAHLCDKNRLTVIQGNATDPLIAHTQYDQTKPTMIIISGTHGVEGYAGADIQNSILNKPRLYKDINLILIFGLNQWGMRQGQRYTRNNIDLNRNMISGKDDIPTSIYDKELNELFLKQIGRRSDILTMLDFFMRWGIYTKENATAVMSGQYTEPCGFEYGGWGGNIDMAPEHEYTLHILKQIMNGKKVPRIVIWDIHTGVGDPVSPSTGVQDILISDDTRQTQLLKKALKDNRNKNRVFQGGSSKIYHVTGSVMNGYARELQPYSKKKIIPITQEFATKNVRDIFIHLVQRRPGRELQDLFYIDQDWWKKGVEDRGNVLYNDLVDYLIK